MAALRQRTAAVMRGAVLAAAALFLAAPAARAQPATPGPDSTPQIGQLSKDSVWVPTPERMIRRLLQMADTTPADVVIDLGSGDGRMPIHAARHFGARAIGVELEANLVRVSEATARAQGVADRVQFVRQDLFEADLAKVTVIALYLSPGAMDRLRPKLLATRPGTRVVSHQFTLGDWEPDETIRVEGRTGHLWVVPADVRGVWRVAGDGAGGSADLRITIEQKHQKLVTRGERGGKPVNVIGAVLRGDEISFTAFDPDGNSRRYSGRVDGARAIGEAAGESGAVSRWTATRD